MLQHLFGNKKGISIIELLTAVAIISFAVVSLLELTSFCLRITSIINQNNKANNMAQEMMEQIRNFRDVTSWNIDGLETITPSTDYYIQKAGTPATWQLIQGTKTVNGFTRKAVFEDVMRDLNDDIVESGGVNDPNTKKITVTVSWEERGNSRQIEFVSYFTNWKQ